VSNESFKTIVMPNKTPNTHHNSRQHNLSGRCQHNFL
jgi:hypothetical protein